jgi:hypothetical protein
MSEDPRARRARRVLWLVVGGFILFNALAFLSTCQ